mmetsp:Transcript_162831/g.522005  ORF Transcript_162831/g.522005 Transcript_162831/m.522005 type:complete len:90 (+) Transcript_162831:156-425(+)
MDTVVPNTLRPDAGVDAQSLLAVDALSCFDEGAVFPQQKPFFSFLAELFFVVVFFEEAPFDAAAASDGTAGVGAAGAALVSTMFWRLIL